MAQPVTLVSYEKLLPGGQLVNRLQDLGYQVQTFNRPADLLAQAEQYKPLFAIVDVEPQAEASCDAISRLRKNQATAHIPVIAIVSAAREDLQASAREAGASLVVNDQAILVHLNELLEQALHVE